MKKGKLLKKVRFEHFGPEDQPEIDLALGKLNHPLSQTELAAFKYRGSFRGLCVLTIWGLLFCILLTIILV